MKRFDFTRRHALSACGSILAASRWLRSQPQELLGEPPGRIAPAGELVNAFEFELMAKRKLNSALYAEIAGSERGALDRITFNPRMMVNTSALDLTTPLFGDNLFAPILIGPIADQKRYHPEGELAMVRGAAAGKTALIVADHPSVAIEEIAAQAKTPLWSQIYPGNDAAAARSRAAQAVKAGCKVVVITTGVPYRVEGAEPSAALPDWKLIDQVRQGISVPVILKGIMTAEDAKTAVSHGFQGIVVSNYGGRSIPATESSILALPSIADAVAGKAIVLVDGGIRRGSDVLKALALGAQAALIGRPAAWSLAAHGTDGVQDLLQLMQNELARDMIMCGLVNPKSITRAAVTIHHR
jgi:isopentenyl diphosphate isomerase/L-lactate dehydrogenase-like FMN-dependent dehydrogenase